MVAILARTHKARVLIEREGDLRLEGKPGAFQNDFGC